VYYGHNSLWASSSRCRYLGYRQHLAKACIDRAQVLWTVLVILLRCSASSSGCFAVQDRQGPAGARFADWYRHEPGTRNTRLTVFRVSRSRAPGPYGGGEQDCGLSVRSADTATRLRPSC